MSQNNKILDPLKDLRTWQRFHFKLIALYGGTVLVCLILTGFILYKIWINAEFKGLQRRLLAIVTSLSASIDADKITAIPIDSTEITPFHKEILSRFEEVCVRDPDIETIYIFRPTNEPTKLRFLVDYSKIDIYGNPGDLYDASDVPILLKGFAKPSVENKPYRDEFGLTLSGYAPIFNTEGQSVGLVGVDVQVSRIQQMRQQVLFIILGVFGFAIIIIGLVSFTVARNVRQPLTKIINAATAIAGGKLDTRIQMDRHDEFGIMSQHFDLMAEGLQEREFIRETFGRYMSEDVARMLLDCRGSGILQGEEKIVTVLFSDLQGYSTISEQLPPAKVIEMLNQYLEAMNKLIDIYHGCVIEYLGDAILAVFGAPYYMADHSEQAFRCAIEMRNRLKELNKEWKKSGIACYWKQSGISELKVRIGIHTGPVVAGNLGSRTRMKYAVIGDTVNVASRLEALNKEFDSDICLSRDVYIHLPNDLTSNMTHRGDFQVKGREQSVRIYTL
ncbi:MAG: adenylate/guanylate cyclase domain-containing protein [bacterium]